MPDFIITSPDGQKYRWTGEKPPGPSDIQALQRSLGQASPPAAGQPPAPPAAPKPPAKAGPKQFLGASTKPASIRPRGGTLYESQPFVAGAVGGMIGGTTGAPAGPPGAFAGALAGAGTGGLLGRYTQYLEQRLVGGTKLGDFLGIPPLSADESSRTVTGEMGKEATNQIEMEAGGQAMAAPLGWLRRGGWLKFDRGTMATMRENTARGTRLSGPEIASGTKTGDVGKSVQAYAAGSFAGGPMQKSVREQGTAAAMKELDTALAVLGPPGRGATAAGTAAEAGIGAAKAGQRAVGSALEAEAEHATTSGVAVDLREAKQAALDELSHTIGPRIAAFPDIATDKRVAATVRALRSDPGVIQRLPRPAMLKLLDVILEKTNSPSLKMLREILGAEDDANFRGVWEQSKVLRRGATPDDQLYAKNDVQRLSTHFNGLLRQALAKASPEFDAMASIYRRGARVLDSKAIKTILKTAVDKPEAVVALFQDNPTRAAQLQRTLKAVAVKGPDGARAKAAYDLIRSSYLREQVIQGGEALPTTEEGLDHMLHGLKDRLAAERQSGVLPQWFSDPRGRQVLTNLDAIADLMSKRTQATTGRLRQIFEISRVVGASITAGGAIAAGRSIPGTVLTTAVAWEALPDFFVWAAHDPRAIKWFIEGVNASDPTVSSAAVVRLMELWRQQHQGASKNQKTVPPTPPR
jgi:hypothetical protein